MTFCPVCETEIPPGSTNCPSCGQQISPDEIPALSATICLRRASQFTAVFTKFEVFIDDQPVGMIENGAQETYTVEPGIHLLHLRIDTFVTKKVRFSLEPGETINLYCRPKILGFGATIGLE